MFRLLRTDGLVSSGKAHALCCDVERVRASLNVCGKERSLTQRITQNNARLTPSVALTAICKTPLPCSKCLSAADLHVKLANVYGIGEVLLALIQRAACALRRVRSNFRMFGEPDRFHCKLSAFGLRPVAMNGTGVGHFSGTILSQRCTPW